MHRSLFKTVLSLLFTKLMTDTVSLLNFCWLLFSETIQLRYTFVSESTHDSCYLQASKMMAKFIDIFVCITETDIATASVPESYINVIHVVTCKYLTCKHKIYVWDTPRFHVHVRGNCTPGKKSNLLFDKYFRL